MLAIITLPFYIKALTNLKIKPKNGRTTSLACIIYVIDTVVGVFYTLYFIYFWFSNEDTAESTSTTSAIDSASTSAVTSYNKSSESASQTRELFLTLSGTIIFTVVRFYFALNIISFTKLLLKQLKYERTNEVKDEEFEQLVIATGTMAKVKRFIFNLESKAQEKLSDYFRS